MAAWLDASNYYDVLGNFTLLNRQCQDIKTEQRANIKFYRENATEICMLLKKRYGDECLELTRVFERFGAIIG